MPDITYSERKDLPNLPLRDLFHAVGWSDGSETPIMLENFNRSFIHSTYVCSAWDGDKLVACVRVLSDTMFRSVIYDLAVLPEYQHKGIGRELLRRCRAQWPDSEWLVQTEPHIAAYYEKNGFARLQDSVFLRIPGKWC